MPTRIRSVDTHRRSVLSTGWELGCAPAGAAAPAEWNAIATLDTVAAALREAGLWTLDGAVRRFDAEDWWYRLRFSAPSREPHSLLVLGFDGLAGSAQVWLNGAQLLRSDNMFHEHEIALEGLEAHGNELLLKFSSLDAQLPARRPRPRWRTPMVENQQLRWFRTTLLGRTPGWSPPAAPVGPWRPAWLETRARYDLRDLDLRTTVREGTGIVELSCRIDALDGASPASAELIVERDGKSHRTPLRFVGATGSATARLEVPQAALWWPHTHGEPALYDACVAIAASDRREGARFELQRIGFRTLSLDSRDGDFQLRVNGEAIFCRGACWMPLDAVSPHGAGPEVDAAVTQARIAGMNMLRLTGTAVYESDRFLDACDAQGMLLWQDFMFANMDYPGDDAAFVASVEREAAQWLARVRARPSTALLCGNSECEQQAAMWGAPRETWTQKLFDATLREQCRVHAADIPYWPSSAHGGAFPHQGDVGTTSYYGVGAYRRPLSDARRAAVRFATECLAFANIPEESTLAAMPGGLALRSHHPAWKSRTPRDLGAGWDFEDIRDHYLRELFKVDPPDLRYADHDRYLELSRLASAEAMAGAFREWRRVRSSCRGALIWFLRDLWRGAGWGIVDADGRAKAPWYLLRNLLQPRAVLLTDEGGNGLYVHLLNETAATLQARLDLAAYRMDGVRIAHATREVEVPPRGAVECPAATCLEGFMDLSYAYRFGPPSHEVVVATITDASGAPVAQDFYFPLGHSNHREVDLGLEARAVPLEDGTWTLVLRTRRCARHIHIRAEGFEAEDQYFHLAPGAERLIVLRPSGKAVPLKGVVQASNASTPVRIEIIR